MKNLSVKLTATINNEDMDLTIDNLNGDMLIQVTCKEIANILAGFQNVPSQVYLPASFVYDGVETHVNMALGRALENKGIPYVHLNTKEVFVMKNPVNTTEVKVTYSPEEVKEVADIVAAAIHDLGDDEDAEAILNAKTSTRFEKAVEAAFAKMEGKSKDAAKAVSGLWGSAKAYLKEKGLFGTLRHGLVIALKKLAALAKGTIVFSFHTTVELLNRVGLILCFAGNQALDFATVTKENFVNDIVEPVKNA